MKAKASINGFELRSIQTMEGEDGEMLRCKVYRNGKYVGDYFDPADGRPSSWYPKTMMYEEMLEAVASLPKSEYHIEGVDGQMIDGVLDPNIDTLVNMLFDLLECHKRFEKAQKMGCIVFVVRDDAWGSLGVSFMGKPSVSDETVLNEVAKSRKVSENTKVIRYQSEADFHQNF